MRYEYDSKHNVHIQAFDSIQDCEDAMPASLEVCDDRNVVSQASWHGFPQDVDFRVNETLDAIKLTAFTSPSDIGRIEKILSEIPMDKIPRPMVRRRKRILSECGEELNVDRLLQNDPECYETYQRTPRVGLQRATIMFSSTASASVRPEAIFWRGATAVALCQLLEIAGWSCRLIASSFTRANYANDSHSALMVIAKDYGTPLCLSSISSIAPSWFFRAVFMQLESHPSINSRVNPWHGYPESIYANYPQAAIKRVFTDQNATILIDGIWNCDASVRFITETINALDSQ